MKARLEKDAVSNIIYVVDDVSIIDFPTSRGCFYILQFCESIQIYIDESSSSAMDD